MSDLGRRAFVVGGAAILSASIGCNEVPKGGVPKTAADTTAKKPALSRRLLPNEIIPADLDIVVRVDLDQLRRTLGPPFEQELAARFSADPLVAKALPSARTMTVAVRAADFEHGDHVLVLEGPRPDLRLGEAGFAPVESRNDKVRIFTRSLTAARDATDTVVVLDERALAFVTPVETDAVMRVLRNGPDTARGQPVAEGIVSADVRVKRLPQSLERKYPSFGRLVAQIQRLKVVLRVTDEALQIEGEIVTESDAAADKVRRFLDAFREGASGEGASAILKAMKLEKLAAVVRVRSSLSVRELARLLPQREGEAAPPP